jgi:MFS family permease
MTETLAANSVDQQEHLAGNGHRAAVLAGFLGLMLDAFDFFLVVFCLTGIAQEFHQSDRAIALSITLTLAFRPVGAFIFGYLADQFGRRGPLMLALVFYSVIELLSGLAPNYVTFLVCAPVRNRDGWRMGRRDISRHGGGAKGTARTLIGTTATGLRSGLPARGAVLCLRVSTIRLATVVLAGRAAGSAGAVCSIPREGI